MQNFTRATVCTSWTEVTGWGRLKYQGVFPGSLAMRVAFSPHLSFSTTVRQGGAEEGDKKKKENRTVGINTAQQVTPEANGKPPSPADPLSTPFCAQRPPTVETKGEIYRGGCRCADRTGCEGCQATFRSLIDHRHGPHPSETIPPPSPPPPLPSPSPARYYHVARL